MAIQINNRWSGEINSEYKLVIIYQFIPNFENYLYLNSNVQQKNVIFFVDQNKDMTLCTLLIKPKVKVYFWFAY